MGGSSFHCPEILLDGGFWMFSDGWDPGRSTISYNLIRSSRLLIVKNGILVFHIVRLVCEKSTRPVPEG